MERGAFREPWAPRTGHLQKHGPCYLLIQSVPASRKDVGHPFPFLELPKLPIALRTEFLAQATGARQQAASPFLQSLLSLFLPDSPCSRHKGLSSLLLNALCCFLVPDLGAICCFLCLGTRSLSFSLHCTSFKSQLHPFFSGRLPHCLNRMNP